MTTRMNWLYLVAISMVLALVPSRAHAQSACVDSNTPAGFALATLNEHLDRIGSRLNALDTLFSGPIGLVGLLVAQDASSQLQADANNLSVDLPEIGAALGQVLPGGLPGTIQTLPPVVNSVSISLIKPLLSLVSSLLAKLPGGSIPIPGSDPARVAVSELRTDLQASRATLPPFCD